MNQYTAAKTVNTETAHYVVKLFNDGKDAAFICNNLVQNGYSYNDASALVSVIE